MAFRLKRKKLYQRYGQKKTYLTRSDPITVSKILAGIRTNDAI